jgi:phosphoglucosamine mutase
VRNDVRVSRKEPFANHKDISQAIAAAEDALKNKGRVFVRYSGTEPLARVMVEGEDAQQISKLSLAIANSIQRILG